MKPHKHAELMKQYAEDAAETDKPWLRWQYRVNSEGWLDSETHLSWGSAVGYRRKPKEYQMTNANWERVIDEGFYTLEVGDAAIKKLSTPPFSWGCISDHVTVVREKGLRQPHFVGDKHPECKTVVCVKIRGGEELFCRYAESINWDDVVEYIVL